MQPDYLKRLIAKKAMEKGVWDDPEVRARIAEEFKQFDIKGEWSQIAEALSEGLVRENPNGVMCYWLLGICEQRPESPLIYDRSNEFPDIDTDLPPDARDVVKAFAKEKFGADRVVSIATYGTLGIRSVLHDVARVMCWPRDEIDAITKDMDEPQLIQMSQDFDGEELWEHAKQAFPGLAEFCRPPDRAKDGEGYDRQVMRNIIGQRCSGLIGRVRSMGKHAGGIIIANHNISELVPLVAARNGETMSAWTNGLASKDLENFGYVKFDFLGLNNLDYIDKCLAALEADGLIERPFLDNGSGMDWSDVSYLNDPACMEAAKQGRLLAVFQFDSLGIRGLCKELGVDTFDLLAATTAAYRPGPLASGMTDRLIKRKNGIGEEAGWEQNMHPILYEELKATYGVPIYQEQVMRLFHRVGNISLPECEKLRKAIGKKDKKTFGAYRDRFIAEGQKTLGYTAEQMEGMWDEIEKNAGYLFNKSHAVAYTYVSARCLFLKTHYPAHYYAAACSCLKPGDVRIKQYFHAARQESGGGFPIQLLPVDVNQSGIDFKVLLEAPDGFPEEAGGRLVRFPLSKVLGVGSAASKIVELQPYKDLNDFFLRFGTDKRVVEPLIKLGALSSLSNMNRRTTLDYFEKYRQVKSNVGVKMLKEALKEAGYSPRYRNDPVMDDYKDKFGKKQVPLIEFCEWADSSKPLAEKVATDKVRELITAEINSRFDAIEVDELSEFSDPEIAQFELEYLKLYFTHPIEQFDRGECPLLVADADETLAAEGIITDVREKLTKRGNPFYRITVEDDTGGVEFTVWDNQYQTYRMALQAGKAVRVFFEPKHERFGFNLRKGQESVQLLEAKITEKMKMDHRAAAEAEFEARLKQLQDAGG